MRAQPGGVYFCIDGGGTRSRARLLAPDGRSLAAATSGPCNPSTSRTRAVESLLDLWRQCCSGANRDEDQAGDATLAIGAAGLYVPSSREAFIAECPRFGGVTAMTDGYAALVGAGGGAPSALIIAGTGIAGHRLYADGRSIQRDAWGWVAGDRGSGAWIGRWAVRHCFDVIDGLRPRDGLARAVLDLIGGMSAIRDGWLRDLGPDRLGALAPVVLDRADSGDPTARDIRDRAVAHLAALAGVLDAAAVPLFGGGGLLGPLRPLLADRIGRAVLEPGADALAGCWLVASGRAPTETADFFNLSTEFFA